jgi:transcriptional regulator with XRE-family HTH domain
MPVWFCDMKEPTTPIAKAVRQARTQAGMSQYDLAKVSGVARITIAGIEMGRHASIRTSTAEKIASALGMTPGELLQAGQSQRAVGKQEGVDVLLASFQKLKKGTVMVANASEERWLRHQLSEWAGSKEPTETSVLFMLLALRHAS